MPSANEVNHPCLDLLAISWISDSGQVSEQCATLLDISRSGGTLHVDCPIAAGTRIRIRLDDTNEVEAEVQGYEHDAYGWYFTIAVSKPWYPHLFQPAYTLSTAPAPETGLNPDSNSRPEVLPIALPLT